MENPAELTDEQLDAAIEGKTEEPQPSEPEVKPSEPAPTEEKEPEGQAEPEGSEPAVEEPEEKPPSRREQLRVQDLLSKYGPPPQQQAPQTPKQQEAQEKLDYAKQLDADPEVIAQLEADRDALGRQQFQQGQQQGQSEALKQVQSVEWRTLLHVDAPAVEGKYKWLDQKDEAKYHPALAKALNQRYLNMVGYNESDGSVERPGIRYSDFVESEVELATEIAREMTANTSKNIARQAASTGIRPDGSAAKSLNLNKAPDQMTDEELDAVIGTLPRDAQGRFVGR